MPHLAEPQQLFFFQALKIISVNFSLKSINFATFFVYTQKRYNKQGGVSIPICYLFYTPTQVAWSLKKMSHT